ncbi:AlpA family transcriptional regulator [Pseudomonas sp.]|uniref:helix-turn-helix transcriptional regulator n=1 Tax=Pseudomonas sp. TaxID=306 RepID=UPI00326583A4
MKMIRVQDVSNLTSLGKSTIYKLIKEGTFPKQVSLGERCVAWVESEVQEWILARIDERDLGEQVVA